jgi:hypothetical protein
LFYNDGNTVWESATRRNFGMAFALQEVRNALEEGGPKDA